MAEPKASILPMYLVADESGSMNQVVGVLNSALASLLDAIHDEPLVAAKVRFGLIGFADRPEVRLSLTDLRQVQHMPQLGADGTTSFQSVFDDLRGRIPYDISALKAQGYAVHRPAVFFLTDGVPNQGEDWRSALARLKDGTFRERPNLLAFGVGDADPTIILELASRPEFALVAKAGVETGEALRRFAVALVGSIIASGNAAASGAQDVVVERPDGFVMAMDLV